MSNDKLAPMRRRVGEALFRLAPLNGVRGLSLEGLSPDDLARLELLEQHVRRELEDLKHKVGQARRGMFPR